MDTLYNISAIKKRMIKAPDGNNLHLYFGKGATEAISDDDKKEIIKIIKEELTNVVEYIESTIKKESTNENKDTIK